MPLQIEGPGGATLHEVRGADSPLLPTACDLFAELFPEDRRYIPYLRACAQGRHPSHPFTKDHVWLVCQAGNWVGLRVFSYITTRKFGHGAYIGFLPDYQGKGLGSWLVDQTLEQLDLDAALFGHSPGIGYIVEVERPMDAESREEFLLREKRIQFHRRCGGIILPIPYLEPVMIQGVDYISDSDLAEEHPRPMHLILIPSALGRQVAHLDIPELLSGIYYDVYRLPGGHEFVSRSLAFLTNGAQR